MSKFVTGKDLENAIYDTIWNAKEKLVLVSPYIKLGKYFRELLNNHINNPKIHIIIVFGKNEYDRSKSLDKEDFHFFQQFMKVSIVYVPSLHAKYYANESKGILTSINLYDFSFKNNIEFGVCFEASLLNTITSKTDIDAWDEAMRLAENYEAVFIKRPVFEKKLVFSKSYIKSDVLHDTTEQFYGLGVITRNKKRMADFPEEIELGSKKTEMPKRKDVEEVVRKNPSGIISNTGYCIRTGSPIPFNPSRPFCDSAFRSWAQYSNWDFPEVYCHRTGLPSYGKTSMRKPIL